jgi:hypothetical protein
MPEPIHNLIPVVVRLFRMLAEDTPEIGRLMVRKGDAIGFTSTNPINEKDAVQALARKYKIKQRDPRLPGKDSSNVIKVSDAIDIIEKQGNKGSPLWAAVKSGVKIVSLGALGIQNTESAIESILDPIVQEIRENALRQDTPRVFSHTFRYHRPSKGHGYGRRQI